MTTIPISFRLREHVARCPHRRVPAAASPPVSARVRASHAAPDSAPIPAAPAERRHPVRDEGITNAWFPAGTELREAPQDEELVVCLPGRGGRMVRYATVREGARVDVGGDEREQDGEERCVRCATGRETSRGLHFEPEKADAGPARVGSDVEDKLGEFDSAEDGSEAAIRNVFGASVDAILGAEMAVGVGEDSKYASGARDVIITGEVRLPLFSPQTTSNTSSLVQTLPQHGAAWHHYRYYGRVRRWDGLVALVRVPASRPELGVSIFRGHVLGGAHFVGGWRAYASGDALPLEGPFVASRAPGAE
jgi:hypothetical protein